MANAQLKRETAEETVERVNIALREGYRPQGQTGAQSKGDSSAGFAGNGMISAMPHPTKLPLDATANCERIPRILGFVAEPPSGQGQSRHSKAVPQVLGGHASPHRNPVGIGSFGPIGSPVSRLT